jgi:hypothetical protein
VKKTTIVACEHETVIKYTARAHVTASPLLLLLMSDASQLPPWAGSLHLAHAPAAFAARAPALRELARESVLGPALADAPSPGSARAEAADLRVRARSRPLAHR